MQKEWKELSATDIAKELNTDISCGLSNKEARERLAEEKRQDATRDTSLFVRKKRPAYDCFLAVVKMLPAFLLTFVGVAAFFMGRAQLAETVIMTFISGSIISGMLYLNAQRENEQLELYSNPSSRVLRDKKQYVTDSRNVVMGDIICLSAGDYIPCDCKIIFSTDLSVDEISALDGKITRKNVEKGVLFDDVLFAGSFVNSGTARVIAVKSGEKAEISKNLSAGMLGMKNGDPKIMRGVHNILFKMTTYASVVALCFAIIGIFTAREVGLLEIFLMFLSFMLSITLISSPIAGRILCSAMLKRAARSKNAADFAIIKNNTALDMLPNLTDVVLLGRAGLGDGKMHFSSMLSSSDVQYEIIKSQDKKQLLECAYAYSLAKNTYADETGNICYDDFSEGIEAMLSNFDFDREEVDMKMRSLYYINNEENGMGYACVEYATESFRAALTENPDVIEFCNLFRLNGKIEEFTEGDKMLARNYIKDTDSLGERVLIVISERDGESVFEGIIGFSEMAAPEYAESCEFLENKGIRVTVMMAEEDNYNLGCITRLGIDEYDIVRASKNDIDLNRVAPAYIGYDVSVYRDMIRKMKSEGRVVAVCAIEDIYTPVCREADVRISYDNINYGSKKYSEAVFANVPNDGRADGVRCSQKMRAYSSVIVARTSERGGGLRGVIGAITTAEFFAYCYLQMMFGFAGFEVALTLLTILSFASGFLIISYPVILLLCVAFVFFSVAAYSNFKPRTLVDKKIADLKKFSDAMSSKMCSHVVACAAYFAAVIILTVCGLLSGVAAIPLSTLLAVIVTLMWRFFGSMKLCLGKSIELSDIKGLAEKQKTKSGILNMAAITLVITSIARMFLTALIFPSFKYEYGFNGICLGTFILFAVYIVSFIACELVLKIFVQKAPKK